MIRDLNTQTIDECFRLFGKQQVLVFHDGVLRESENRLREMGFTVKNDEYYRHEGIIYHNLMFEAIYLDVEKINNETN